jgi:hypothetical protein
VLSYRLGKKGDMAMSTRREFVLHTAAASVLAATSRLGASAEKSPPYSSKSPLKTYRIPHTDLTITRLGFGCAMLGIDWDAPDFVTNPSLPIRP